MIPSPGVTTSSAASKISMPLRLTPSMGNPWQTVPVTGVGTGRPVWSGIGAVMSISKVNAVA